MNPRIQALSELFTSRQERFLTDLFELVKRESPSDESAKVTALASWIALRLGGAGVEARTVACGTRGHAVLARTGPAGDGGTLLVGHIDTVWPLGTLAEIPFKINEGVATGPGVFDMKGGVAVAISLMSAIAQGLVKPVAPVALLLTPDEEIGTEASRELLVEEARKHERVLVLEPSADGGAAKIARKGIGLIEASFLGIASHAGLEPEKGASALAEMARFVLFASSLGSAEAGTSVVPTTASAGTKTNVVPEKARVTVDYRLWTVAEGERVTDALRGYTPLDPRVTVTITGGVNRPPMEPTEVSLGLHQRLGRLAGVLGFDLPAARVGGASDGNLTAAAGVPTLDGLGPNGGGAHARTENLVVADMPRRAALLASYLEDLSPEEPAPVEVPAEAPVVAPEDVPLAAASPIETQPIEPASLEPASLEPSRVESPEGSSEEGVPSEYLGEPLSLGDASEVLADVPAEGERPTQG